MRQRRNFDAHVLEYAALKIPALSFQAAKSVFCKFAQQPAIAFAFAPASLRKATQRPAPDGVQIFLTRKVFLWSWLNETCQYHMHLVEVVHVFVCYQNLSTRCAARIFRATKKVQGSFSGSNKINGSWLKRNSIRSGNVLWHKRGAEGDHLSECSERGKLPQLWPRCPRRFVEAENSMGCSGRSAGGKRGLAPRKCWHRQHDRKSGVGRGFGAP